MGAITGDLLGPSTRMKKLFFGFIPITLVAGVSLFMIAIVFDPFKADGTVKFLFFASLAAFLWGCGAIVFFILNLFSHDRTVDALRRGFFIALLVLALVCLKKYGVLHWYTAFTATVIIMLLEFLVYKGAKLTVRDNNDNLKY